MRLAIKPYAMLQNGESFVPTGFAPIASNPIFGKCDDRLHIWDISDVESPVAGQKKMILLCDRIDVKDTGLKILVKDDSNQVIWHRLIDLDFNATPNKVRVHNGVAITFFTPPYFDLNITDSVEAKVHLYRKDDPQNMDGINSMAFKYVPANPSKGFADGRPVEKAHANRFSVFLCSKSSDMLQCYRFNY